MIRLLFQLHRYLGIVFGILLVLWCLSGFVMMYVQYPELSHDQQLAGLAGLDLSDCCNLDESGYADDVPLLGFVIEMLGDSPVVRIEDEYSGTWMIDLRSGEDLDAIDETRAFQVAAGYHQRQQLDSPLVPLGRIERDQWTVNGGEFDRYRPLFKFAAGSAVGVQWYVSGRSGEVVQQTTPSQRAWNWLGSVVHWLYPTVLRQHAGPWNQVVVWTSIAGLFLVGIGLYIGITQFRVREGTPRSPYKGMALWHHYAGLVFGLFVLTWVGSGLLSMNPWGLLAGQGAAMEQQRLQGTSLTMRQLREVIHSLPQQTRWEDPVRVQSTMLDGKLALLVWPRQGSVARVNPVTFEPVSLGDTDWKRARELIMPETPVHLAGWLYSDDAYYYRHHESVAFPVYRIIYDDPGSTRYYLDAVSGDILSKVDSNARWSRWLFHGLHRGDFAYWLRQRPVWDVILLVLLLGVSLVCISGCYMGVRFLFR